MSSSNSSSGYPRAQLESLIGARRYPEALRLITSLEAEHPGDRDLLYARAYCLAAMGNLEEARQAAQTLGVIYGDPRGSQILAQIGAAETPVKAGQRPTRTGTHSGRRTTAFVAAAVLVLLVAGGGVFFWLSTESEKAVPAPTLTVQAPIALETSEGPINLGSHAVPRLLDWNNDGLFDLLVGGGDGYIWIFLNIGSKSAPLFAKGEIIQDGGRDMRMGDRYTGACFIDINGDGLKDLVISHSRNELGYYPNVGNGRDPSFDGYESFIGPDGEELRTMPETPTGKRQTDIKGCIEVADWDGDGLNDIIVGGFDGYLFLYKNSGTPSGPRFETEPDIFLRGGEPIKSAYNIHPKAYDFNGDGLLDLSFGNNWANVHILTNTRGSGVLDFSSGVLLRFEDGRKFDHTLREIVEDDTIPNFGDLNGDGVADVVTGGKIGIVFVMYGVSHRELMQRIDVTLAEHGDNLQAALRADEALRKTYEAQHLSLRQLVQDIQPAAEVRQEIRDWYMSHPEIAPLRP